MKKLQEEIELGLPPWKQKEMKNQEATDANSSGQK